MANEIAQNVVEKSTSNLPISDVSNLTGNDLSNHPEKNIETFIYFHSAIRKMNVLQQEQRKHGYIVIFTYMEIYRKITRNSIATLTDRSRYVYQRLILHYLTAQHWKGAGSVVQLSSPLMSGTLYSFPTLSQKTAIFSLFIKIVY